MAASEIKTML